jgi:hypothetical protein
MTSVCGRCGETFPRKVRGRPPKFCKGACRVAAHREQRKQATGLSADQLARQMTARGEPTTAELAVALVSGLQPGYAECVGGVWRLGPAAVGLLEWIRFIEDGNAPLEPGDEAGPVRLPPGPTSKARPRELAAA